MVSRNDSDPAEHTVTDQDAPKGADGTPDPAHTVDVPTPLGVTSVEVDNASSGTAQAEPGAVEADAAPEQPEAPKRTRKRAARSTETGAASTSEAPGAPEAPARKRTRKATTPKATAEAPEPTQAPEVGQPEAAVDAAVDPSPGQDAEAGAITESAARPGSDDGPMRLEDLLTPVADPDSDDSTTSAAAAAQDLLDSLVFPPPRDSRAAAAAEDEAQIGDAGEDDDDDQQDSDGPALPTFGLIFQAPQPVAEPTRRRRGRAQATLESEESQESEEPTEEESGPLAGAADRGSRADAPDGAVDESDDADGADDVDDTEDQGDDDADDGDRGPRRRRRRGGKGRRRSPGGDTATDDTADTDTDTTDSDDSGDDEDDDGSQGPDDSDSDDQDGSGSARKRTRRRRRSGSATPAGEDPPGTVTKVREPRRDRDVATGIKGSTRLEAKRQRRREGREAGRRRTIITEAEFLARRESVERVMVVRQRDKLTQIGVLEDGVLVEHYISGPGPTSHAGNSSMAGNVYLGRVQNVLPSMEAAFVDIGKGRNAVLYAGEVNWDAAGLEQHKARRIENALSSGQSVLVQVTKDPIGHKGARLTSQVSLPGRYLVYVPDGSMTGISRKLPDTERARLKRILKEILPDDAGVIVRTAAEGASEEELKADVDRLTREWDRIQGKSKNGNAPSLLHGEPDLTVRVVRDVFNEDFTKLVVSGDDAWGTISDYVHDVAGDLAQRLSKWTGEGDVFAHYRIDEQLTKAMDRKVWLPSGGSLVIDRTEAMTVIDVNTGKFTGAGGNLEETVTKNNIEAAEEIVRQLRLRDIGGIIVIDFIDMVLEANRDLVVRRLMECLGRDRTKHQVAEVTSLGLVQMTRKRVGAGLIEVFSEPCEHCSGRGLVVHSEPVARSNDSGGGSRDSGRDSRDSSRDSGRDSGRRGRRGRSRDGDGGNGGGNGQQAPAPTPSGPTPAQIAAAAYAAAVQAGGHAHEDHAESAEHDEPAGTAEATSVVSEAATDAADRDVPPTAQAAGATMPDPIEPAPDPVEPAPKRRRGARRAAGSPVSAVAEAVVFTVDTIDSSGAGDAEPTDSGGQTAPSAATDSATDFAQPTAAAEQAEADDSAAAAEVTPPPAPRRRRAARRAAGAPAGPPPASGDRE